MPDVTYRSMHYTATVGPTAATVTEHWTYVQHIGGVTTRIPVGEPAKLVATVPVDELDQDLAEEALRGAGFDLVDEWSTDGDQPVVKVDHHDPTP